MRTFKTLRKAIRHRVRVENPLPIGNMSTPSGGHILRKPTAPNRSAWQRAQASNNFWSKIQPKSPRPGVNGPVSSPPDSRDACRAPA